MKYYNTSFLFKMAEYYSKGRRLSGSRPFCPRCGNIVEDKPMTADRGSWAEKGRGLSLEIDGREGRAVRRRHSSANLNSGNQRGSPLHCYIIPFTKASEDTPALTSTYRESFRSPSSNQSFPRQTRSMPSSPVTTMSPWLSASSPSSSSSFSQVFRQPLSSTDTHAHLSRPPSTVRNKNSSFESLNTTYKDHFTWVS